MEEKEQLTVFEDDTIDLMPIIRGWIKNWWLIVIVTVLFGSVTFMVMMLAVTPTYRSSFTAYVSNTIGQDGKTVLSSSDLSASRSLAKTYSVIVRSQVILEDAAEKAGYSGSYESLEEDVTTAVSSDTEIMTVYVESVSPSQARILAESIADSLMEKGPDIVDGSSLKIIGRPKEPSKPFSPRVAGNTAIGMLAGLLIILAVLAIRTLSNTTLSSEAELEERFGLPVLGTIPRQSDAEKGAGSGYAYGYGKQKGAVKNND